MRKILGLITAVLAAAGWVVFVTPDAGADGPQSVAYTCNETDTAVGIPEITAPLTIDAFDSADPAKVFQPVTWTADITEPDLDPPLQIALHYLRVRIPIPANVTVFSATLVAKPGETPNPAISAMSVAVQGGEVVVQLPASPDANHRILSSNTTGLTYPYVEGSFFPGNPVVLPQIVITGVPTSGAAGTTVSWPAPTIDTATVVSVLSTDTAHISCTPDAPVPTIVSTTVTTARQLCDGQAVTVQLGFNAPTAGNDVIQGTTGPDGATLAPVNGLNGNDRFCGLAGNDVFNGAGGTDRAFGSDGADDLRGGAANDTLNGGLGPDRLNGGTQRDVCNGGPQTDTATACESRPGVP